ncbi:MAG: hypothetical protein ACOH2H_26165 [Cypionkella sp.]
MRQFLFLVCLCLGFGAGPSTAGETYDLLFRSGALDQLVTASQTGTGDVSLEYERTTFGTPDGTEPGAFRLNLRMVPPDNAELVLHQGDLKRDIGIFPASVGNPVIMYFMETTLRDMAGKTGGSPFYIRNRIKDALLTDAEILPVTVRLGDSDVDARQITLLPFAHDTARARMGRFADLKLVVTVSEKVPGWYYSLVSTAPSDPGAPDTRYSNAITLSAKPEGGQ